MDSDSISVRGETLVVTAEEEPVRREGSIVTIEDQPVSSEGLVVVIVEEEPVHRERSVVTGEEPIRRAKSAATPSRWGRIWATLFKRTTAARRCRRHRSSAGGELDRGLDYAELGRNRVERT
jgi:hypothetical protein